MFRPRKVFCIGFNKTGTTSLKATLNQLGFLIGNQQEGEKLLSDWSKRDFRKLIRLSYTAEVFQDVPFSLPFTYVALHQAFPNAKFILTVRNSSEEWYKSICRFHSKIWGDGINSPSTEQLKKANYLYQGMPYDFNQLVFGANKETPYEKEQLISVYENHNRNVEYYFKSNSNFLKINVSLDKEYKKMCDFLNVEPKQDGFLWLNKTQTK